MSTVSGNDGKIERGGLDLKGCILSPSILAKQNKFLHEAFKLITWICASKQEQT